MYREQTACPRDVENRLLSLALPSDVLCQQLRGHRFQIVLLVLHLLLKPHCSKETLHELAVLFLLILHLQHKTFHGLLDNDHKSLLVGEHDNEILETVLLEFQLRARHLRVALDALHDLPVGLVSLHFRFHGTSYLSYISRGAGRRVLLAWCISST
jgi:hypothetical protein